MGGEGGVESESESDGGGVVEEQEEEKEWVKVEEEKAEEVEEVEGGAGGGAQCLGVSPKVWKCIRSKGTSLIRNCPHPGTTVGPCA